MAHLRQGQRLVPTLGAFTVVFGETAELKRWPWAMLPTPCLSLSFVLKIQLKVLLGAPLLSATFPFSVDLHFIWNFPGRVSSSFRPT